MDRIELEDLLDGILPGGYRIEEDDNGQLIISTGLVETDDGDLISLHSDTDEDVDPDFEQLEDDDAED